jgi:hypothetical protein
MAQDTHPAFLAAQSWQALTAPQGHASFDVVYAKTMTMIDSEPEIDLAKLAAVSAPPRCCKGTGMRSRSSMGRGCRGLGDGRLAVLPGTHLPVELPEVVNPLLISFPARSILLL